MLLPCSQARRVPASGPARREAALPTALAAQDFHIPTLRPNALDVARPRTTCHAFHPSNQEPPQPRFSHLGFMRIRLERVTTAHKGNYGFLVFVRHEARKSWLHDAEEGMVVNITGDTLYCLCKLLRNEPTARPMPLDIVTATIDQGQGADCENWGLIRVAITGLKQDTYVAVAYFGNTLTGEVTSESDMRPSDATFLAQNYGTPIYVDVAVWNDTSITRTQMTEYERNHGWPFDCGSGEEAPPQSSTTPNGRPSEAREQHSIVAPLASTDDLAGILDNDPELIKMMKKKMAVAISEENYDQAAQLRDSPLMTLYREIQRHKQNGDTARAAQLQRDLDRSSSGWDFP